MSLYALLAGKGPSGFGYATTAEEATAGLDLSGRTMLLTGCNSGIGLETLRVLSLRGARVLAAARTREKAEAACRAAGAAGAAPLACELSEPASIRACVHAVRALGAPLDAIIANAGIMALPRLKTRLGVELQFFTNHIGHFILVNGLLDRLAERGRVVMVSSRAHFRAPRGGIQLDNLSGEKGYAPWTAYGQSKLANLLFARELSRRLEGTGKTANALHPGVIRTPLTRSAHPIVDLGMSLIGPLALKSIAQGAATQCWAAAHPALEGKSGLYLADCNEAPSSAYGRDMELAARLWAASERIAAEAAKA